jgi:hypothetical protein
VSDHVRKRVHKTNSRLQTGAGDGNQVPRKHTYLPEMEKPWTHVGTQAVPLGWLTHAETTPLVNAGAVDVQGLGTQDEDPDQVPPLHVKLPETVNAALQV